MHITMRGRKVLKILVTSLLERIGAWSLVYEMPYTTRAPYVAEMVFDRDRL